MDAIISNVKKNKFFSNGENYTLVIRGNKTIFVKLIPRLLNDAIKKAKFRAKMQGMGFLRRLAIRFKTIAEFSNRYKEMSDEEILKEDPNNFILDHSQIKKIKVRRKTEVDDDENTYSQIRSDIIFYTHSGKLKFHKNSHCKKEFKKAYGDLVSRF